MSDTVSVQSFASDNPSIGMQVGSIQLTNFSCKIVVERGDFLNGKRFFSSVEAKNSMLLGKPLQIFTTSYQHLSVFFNFFM
jgi:hypothetical protein